MGLVYWLGQLIQLKLVYFIITPYIHNHTYFLKIHILKKRGSCTLQQKKCLWMKHKNLILH